VALDVGPLHGHRTGVGVAVAHLTDALARRQDVALLPYLVSARARVSPPERRLPVPAAVATRTWAAFGRPCADRWLHDAAVVHGTNYVVPPSRRPRLVSVYDAWFLRQPAHAAPAVRRAARILRRAVESGAHVHVSSAATATVAREALGTERVHVVHLGAVTPPAAGPAPRGDLTGAPFVAAIGTLERRKAIPSLVAAFGQLARDRRDVRLVLAGAPGDDADAVRDAVAALGPDAAGRVVLLGPVDEPTKGWLLRHASVLAYPSYDEGFGFPVLEAQAAGVPVVGRRAGSIPEIGGDGIVLVGDAGSGPDRPDLEAPFVAELATALARTLDDGALRLGTIAAGHENVRRFDWDRTARELVALYRTLAEGDR
jgi:glycosyltransferase involved in cell wall biosynthesis